MVVDIHAHVVIPGFGAEPPPSAVREFSDLPRILGEQDRAGVDVVVLCPWVKLLDREPERQNEALAGLVGDRVACLGTVPLERPELLAELVRDGRLSGVEVAASVDGDYLGADRFRPFWAAAEESGLLVFVHPTTMGLGIEALQAHYLWNTVGNPTETTITAAQLVMQGVMDDHPNLKVVLGESAHSWGMLYMEWADHQFEHDGLPREGYDLKPSEMFHRQCYFVSWFDEVAPYADHLGSQPARRERSWGATRCA